MKRVRDRSARCLVETLESRVLLSASFHFGAAAVPTGGTIVALADGADSRGSPDGAGAKARTETAPGAKPSPVAVSVSLAARAIGPTTVYLTWVASGSGIVSFEVLRNGQSLGTVDASARAAADRFADAGTGLVYTLKALDKNKALLATSTAAAATPVNAAITPGNAITVSNRFGDELVVAGSTGTDTITVSQSPAGDIVVNGLSYAAPANGMFIYSYGGADEITVDASVTLRLTIAAIDGAGTTITNSGVNTGIWMDSDDTLIGSCSSVHSVGSYFQRVSKAVGFDIVDPTPVVAGSVTFRVSASLWARGPVMDDVNQGYIGDCYYLASLAAFANSCPETLRDMAVDLGDGTYAVEFNRGGESTYVRVDGDMVLGGYEGFQNAQPNTRAGGTGAIWALVMEKAYAYFRAGANTYDSLSYGYMSEAYADLGFGDYEFLVKSQGSSAFYNTVMDALANDRPITLSTFGVGSTLVEGHVYTLVNTFIGARGVQYYTVRNPWGVSGASLENEFGYATLTYKQMLTSFNWCAIAV
jgi:hypothetical protein